MEFRILGPLEVTAESGPVEINAAKHRTLLCLLLVHANEVVATEVLADALWGERPPPSSRKLLQIYVSQLRRALGPGALLTQPPGYVLEVRRTAVDAGRFEQLAGEGRQALAAGNAALAAGLCARALRLWRGPALADFRYEEFARAEATRLEELRLSVLEDRLQAELAIGRRDELAGELQGLVSAHPLRERFRAQLMVALYRSGRQADALEVYADARRTLVDELGLEPSRELRELERAVLRQDPALELSPTERAAVRDLPAPATRLIGRARELEQLGALVRDPEVRLVTVTGPGGIGKTRLALEAGARSAADFANGVVLVELVPLADHALVVPLIAETLGVKERPGEPLIQTLAAELRPQELLLLVDNLEHLPGAVPSLGALLSAAPRLTLLATSRARLRLQGEHVYAVPPLGVPTPGEQLDLRAVGESAAVILFGERARAVNPGFGLTVENARTVAEICTRLEGVPLAIELAAARVRMLTPEALLERLGRRLPLLTGGAWDLPARQQTLRATIDWSWELLGDFERSLVARLSVFLGGCTLEAAERVCGPGAVLEAMGALLDNSLVARTPDARYRMLETVREYGLGRLEAAGETTALRGRHAEHFLELAERAETELVGANQLAWHERLEAEHDNLRAALAWLRESEQAELELRIAAALGRFWYVRGYLSEGRRALEGAFGRAAAEAPPALRAKALRSASALAVIQGDYSGARALAEQGLALYREVGDRPGIVRSLSNLGAIRLAEGEVDAAISALDESVALSRDLPDRRLAAIALNNRGDVALTHGDYDAAAALFAESLTLLRELGDSANVARSLFNLGAASLERGETEDALKLLRESISLCLELGDKEDVAWCLVGLAAAATKGGDATRGAVVLSAADALLGSMGALPKPYERGLQERTLAAIRDRLDEASFEAAWAEGRALELDRSVARALEPPPSR
ncbi:MAG: tetratricopeptide repeat protein [Actinobacteria bacterium]|nr:tetratricopeptide repeat protein [Actinomycetota bacterium]